MKLGPATLLTCPECRGAMVKVEDGSPVTRFRCHAGHAHTLRSLLADLDQSLDHSLWNVVRGIEERLIILRDLEQEAKARGDHEGLERYRGEISLAQERHRELRQLVLGGRA